jgi:IS30 family transposase
MVRLLHLPRSDADSLHTALVARIQDLPPGLLRSITWDQGTEMARHVTITEVLGIPVYFCDARSPWQRGSNENTNGLLEWTPKGVSLSGHPPAHLLAVENELNNRPRIVLQDRCPTDLFTALLASQNQPVLRRDLEPTLPERGQFSGAVDMGKWLSAWGLPGDAHVDNPRLSMS